MMRDRPWTAAELASRERFAKFAADRGDITECETVGNVIHFTCIDGSVGTYNIPTGMFSWNCNPAVYECEFCGDPATHKEQFDRIVHVCDSCGA